MVSLASSSREKEDNCFVVAGLMLPGPTLEMQSGIAVLCHSVTRSLLNGF